MSKYTILSKYKNNISPYYEKIKNRQIITKEVVEKTRSIAVEYYKALSSIGVAYGGIALSITEIEGEFGKFENAHFLIRANKEGKNEEQIKKIQNNLVVRLMYRDIEMRIDKIKGITNLKQGEYHQIAEYHYQEYTKEGLSEYAWSGALFEEFIGSGSWMKFTGNTVKYREKGDVVCAIHGNKQSANGINAKTAFESLLDTYNTEVGFINLRVSNAWDSSEFSGSFEEKGGMNDAFFRRNTHDSDNNSIHKYIEILKDKVLEFTEYDNCSNDKFSGNSEDEYKLGSIFEESKEVMGILDMFDTPAMQNPQLSNIERFEILRQQSDKKGNLEYTKMFGDIMDRHESVFEALDELIEKQEKDNSHGGEL